MNSVKLQVLPGGRVEGQARQESFVQVFSSLVRCKELSNTAFRLYCLLLDYSWGGKQECNPSQETLAFEMGVKEITIRRAVAELEGFDLITVKSSKNAGCNTYKLNRVVSNVEKLPIINDRSDRSDQINFDGSSRLPLSPVRQLLEMPPRLLTNRMRRDVTGFKLLTLIVRLNRFYRCLLIPEI